MKFIQIEQPVDLGPFHWSRKFFHMLGLLIPLILYLDMFGGLTDFVDSSRTIGVILLFALALFVICIDLIRFRWLVFNQLVFRLFGSIMKEDERQHFNAVTPYMLACAFLFLFCAREVIGLCCIFLMIGDPAAAYIGSRFGRVRFWNHKSLEGMLAFVISAFLVGIVFLMIHTHLAPHSFFALLDPSGALKWPLIWIVLVGSLLAAIFEFFSSIRLRGLWDDNLLVPLGGAVGILLSAWCWYPDQWQLFLFDPANVFRLIATGS